MLACLIVLVRVRPSVNIAGTLGVCYVSLSDLLVRVKPSLGVWYVSLSDCVGLR